MGPRSNASPLAPTKLRRQRAGETVWKSCGLGATPRKTKSKRKPAAVTPSSTGRYFTAVIERLIYQEDNSSRREEGSRVRGFAQFLGQHTPSPQQRRPRKIRIIWQFRLQRNTVYRRYT